MKIDLEAELERVEAELAHAHAKATQWREEALRLEGAKSFAEHLMSIASKSEAPSPTPGSLGVLDDEDATEPVVAGANGAHA